MLGWTLIFAILAVIAGLMGFFALAGLAASIAKLLFVIFLVLLVVNFAIRAFRGQSVLLRGRDAPLEGRIYATLNGVLVAVGDVENGELVPHRVFNLGA